MPDPDPQATTDQVKAFLRSGCSNKALFVVYRPTIELALKITAATLLAVGGYSLAAFLPPFR